MPTGQEELTRERRERLKEVKPFFLWYWNQNGDSFSLYSVWWIHILFLQAKDCLLKTIGEDAKRLVSPTCFIQSYCARHLFLILLNNDAILSPINPISIAVTRNPTWSQSWGVPGALVLVSLTAPSPSMNMSLIYLAKLSLNLLLSSTGTSQNCGQIFRPKLIILGPSGH